MMDGLLVERPRLMLIVSGVFGLLAALLWPAISRPEWVGYLPTTVQAFEWASPWLPCFVCGVAAWLAGQSRAYGVDEWAMSSPLDRRARRRPVVVATVVMAVVVQIIAMLAVTVESLRFGLLDGLDSRWMLISVPTMLAYLVCACAVGTWMGAAWRRSIAVPVALVFPYAVFLTFGGTLADSPIGALTVADSRDFSYVRPALAAWVARLCFWSLLAGALVFRVVKGPSRTGVVLRWMSSVAAAVAIFQGATPATERAAYSPVCVGSQPVVCIESAFRTVLPRYREAIDVLWPNVPSALRPTMVMTENVASSVTVPADGTAVLVAPVHGFNEPARLIDADAFAAYLGDAIFAPRCVEGRLPDSTVSIVIWWRATVGAAVGEQYEIGDWLSSASAEYERAVAGTQALDALSVAERDRWFRENATDIAACVPVELPS